MFTWTEQEDDEILKNGTTIMWAAGCTKAIQRFVENLSNKVGVEAALKLIEDKEYMKQFYVEYSDESYENETYFERLY